MLEVISNWVGRSYSFPNESTVSDTSRPMFEPRIRRQQVGYEARPEVSEVEDSVPSARVREFAKTLEGDSLVLYGGLSGEENVCDIILTKSAVISARKVPLPLFEVSLCCGASWSLELTLPTSAFEGRYAEYLLDTQTEEISGVSAQVIEQIKAWGIRDQVEAALGIIQDTFQNLRAYEANIGTDPEIPERKRLRITLTVSGTPEEVFADELRFKEWMYSTLDIKACELITITYRWEK